MEEKTHIKFSLVMPVLLRDESHRPVVEKTIESLKGNSEDYELIIVDDGSTRPTNFLRREAHIYVRHNPTNKGIAPSWNDGLSIARGEYVVIVNDDILVPDGWLKVLASGFEKTDCGVTGPVIASPTIEPALLNVVETKEDHSFFPGYCFMLKRSRFLERFDERFVPFNFEDTDYWVRIEKAGLKLYKVPLAIWHKEGDTIHKMEYERVGSENHKKFISKWGFDPQPIYYA